jgi:hypothetical protein
VLLEPKRIWVVTLAVRAAVAGLEHRVAVSNPTVCALSYYPLDHALQKQLHVVAVVVAVDGAVFCSTVTASNLKTFTLHQSHYLAKPFKDSTPSRPLRVIAWARPLLFSHAADSPFAPKLLLS